MEQGGGISEVQQGGEGGGGGGLIDSQVKQYDAGGYCKHIPIYVGLSKSVRLMGEVSCRMATVTPLCKYTHAHASLKTGLNT